MLVYLVRVACGLIRFQQASVKMRKRRTGAAVAITGRRAGALAGAIGETPGLMGAHSKALTRQVKAGLNRAGNAAIGLAALAISSRAAHALTTHAQAAQAQTSNPARSPQDFFDLPVADAVGALAALTVASMRADPLGWAMGFIFAALMAALLVYMRRAARARREADARMHELGELSAQLAETEALLRAEPHLLVVWEGKQPAPVQIANGLRDLPGIPQTALEQFEFETWLDERSCGKLNRHIAELRANGIAFDIILRSKTNIVIEASGRTSGRVATLSLRDLDGERLVLADAADQAAQVKNDLANLRAILEAVSMPVWVRDHEGRIIWANRAYARAVELDTTDEVIEQQRELIGEEAEQARRADATDRQDSKPVFAIIAGDRRALNVSGFGLDDGYGFIASDISELGALRGELDQIMTAHSRTLDQLTTAVAIFGADQRLRFYNAAYVELWGLDEAMLNNHPTDSEILDHLREARRLQEQADFRNWKDRRLAAYTRPEPEEDWWYLPDGQTLRVVAQPHPSGGLTYLYDNVTEKLALESRYNALISVQSETLDNLHEGVALFGSDGRLKLHNPAYENIWQLQTHPLSSNPHIDDIIKWCRESLPDEAIWRDLKDAVTSLPGQRQPLSGRVNRPDGMAIEFASVPLPDGATLLTYVDVTAAANVEHALRERADALEAADRLKSEFISRVSRELRTPLTNIIGFAESLELNIAGPLNAKQGEYVGYVLKSSDALLAIVDDILDLATIDAGVMELNVNQVDIADLLAAAEALVRDRMAEASMKFTIDAARELGVFKADERRVKQILVNLLLNAIGFSRPGGEITLACEATDDQVSFSVIDRGRGIDPEHQGRVFEPFESKTLGSDHRGVGLGLSIVKSFVELHGGKVELHSKPDQGTRVTCHLPRMPPPERTTPQPERDQAVPDQPERDGREIA